MEFTAYQSVNQSITQSVQLNWGFPFNRLPKRVIQYSRGASSSLLQKKTIFFSAIFFRPKLIIGTGTGPVRYARIGTRSTGTGGTLG